MGINTLVARATGNTIEATDLNQYRTALDGALVPRASGVPTSDAGALGSATYMWSDLFLDSGGVINFNNGNVTITHSAGSLAFNCAVSGISTLGFGGQMTGSFSAANNTTGLIISNTNATGFGTVIQQGYNNGGAGQVTGFSLQTQYSDTDDAITYFSTLVSGSLSNWMTFDGATDILSINKQAIFAGAVSVAGDVSTTAWTPWTPTISVAGGTVPVYSTVVAKYKKIGKTVFFHLELSGDGGDEGAGAAALAIALPVEANADFTGALPLGSCLYYNNATGGFGIVLPNSSTTMKIQKTDLNVLSGDDQNNATRYIRIYGQYEAA